MDNKELAVYVGEKIKQFRLSNGYTQTEVADKVGIGKSTIANYEKGFRSPRQKVLFQLADVFGVSIDDFFPPTRLEITLGEKRYIPKATTSVTLSDLTQLDQKLTADNRQKWVQYGHSLLEEQETAVEELGITYDVETVSSLAAGLGFSYDDDDKTTVQVTNEPPRHDVASIVDGDSMLPNYHDGDVVYLIDKGISNYSGQVCAVVVNDKTYLKRVYTEPHALRLVSINPKYSDIVIDFPPTEDTHIKIFSVVGSDRVI